MAITGGCWLDRCGQAPYGQGLCKTHWQRLYRTLSPYPLTRRDRFWAKVAEDGDCWRWTGFITPDGYGSANVVGRTQPAHVIAYEEMVGEVPPGLQLDHLCRVRSCVNPYHLDPVTSRVNTLRGETPAARNAAKRSCKRGHPFDARNTHINIYGFRNCRKCRAAAQLRRTRGALAKSK